ncbi:MAG: lipopolysaccharide export system protein LptA [Candidatus Tokpelaia sp. JSC189]|nr:MAG: lipopolysaccharide export system protein LptA [Candidatus Tokpelaia sp. JSC189]
MQFSSLNSWISRLILSISITISIISNSVAHAQKKKIGFNLSGGKEPVQIEADNMEVHDKQGVAIFQGNISVVQGDRILRAGKMIVYYRKPNGIVSQRVDKKPTDGLGPTGIDKMEALDKVYIKVGKQVATGDYSIFEGKSNTIVLKGKKVVLTDGDNVATGCKLTAYMDTGKAFLESCP